MENMLRNLDEWFENYKQLDNRFDTFKKALELCRPNPNIVETGCARFKDDWSDGMSTLVFSNFVKDYGGKVTSIDISKENIEMCSKICEGFDDKLNLIVSDSVEYFSNLTDVKIDLLYLDSYDYPYGSLLEIYGGKVDLSKAIAILKKMSDQEVRGKHKDIINESQEHCLNELISALPFIHNHTPILIDDSGLPGGGKPGLAQGYLKDNNFICIMDKYQSLWIKEK